MDKKIAPLHDLTKSQLRLDTPEPASTAPLANAAMASPAATSAVQGAPATKPALDPSLPPAKGGAIASTVGTSEYKLSSEQKGQLVLMLTGLAVLGGVLAFVVASIVAYQVYKARQYSVITRNQYKTLAIMVTLALGVSIGLFLALFFISDFFRISVSGFYLLTLILTAPALILFAYTRVSYLNYRADRLAAES